jgi:ABC-type uncharacterized transport system substrate-binding protein
MKRRTFIAALGGVAASSLAASAQHGERVRRIGVLGIANDAEAQSWVKVLTTRLGQMGWIEGQTVEIEYRFGAVGDASDMPAAAKEIVDRQPDVIVAVATVATVPLSRHTRSIPIVFVQVSDPVGIGIVKSLARPGGNMTGFSNFEISIATKWLEVLKDIAAGITRVGVLVDSKLPSHPMYVRAIDEAAGSFGVALTHQKVGSAADVERAFQLFAGEGANGLIVLPSPVTLLHRTLIVARAERQRLPAIYPYRYFVVNGGLMSYSVDLFDLYRRAAAYVDRILRGEKPGDLPVQAPTKFELAINLKTAKALGLDVPPTLLARADEVIE